MNKENLKELIENYDIQGNSSKSFNRKSFADQIQDQSCCQLASEGRLCICERDIYHIRPYTFEIMRALQPFFEIIGMSNLPYFELEQIIDHIELVLNKPITELIKNQEEQKLQQKIEAELILRQSQSSPKNNAQF